MIRLNALFLKEANETDDKTIWSAEVFKWSKADGRKMIRETEDLTQEKEKEWSWRSIRYWKPFIIRGVSLGQRKESREVDATVKESVTIRFFQFCSHPFM